MTKLAAGYLNRAQIARHLKARAIEAQRKVWSKDLSDDSGKIPRKRAEKSIETTLSAA